MAKGLNDEEDARDELTILLRENQKSLGQLRKTLVNLTAAITRNRKMGGGGGSGGSSGGGSGGGSSGGNYEGPDETALGKVIAASLDSAMDKLAQNLGSQFRSAIDSMPSGGGGGGGGPERNENGPSTSQALKNQAARLNEATLTKKLSENIRDSFSNVKLETDKLIDQTLSNIVLQGIVARGSEFLSGQQAQKSISNRWELGLEASTRNLGDTFTALTSDLMAFKTGAASYNDTIGAITRGLSNGSDAFSMYNGDVTSYGKDIKTLRKSVENLGIDRNLDFKGQADYFTMLFADQRRAGILDKMDTEQTRIMAQSQLKSFQLVAQNTGKTVEELIKANSKSEGNMAVAELSARGLITEEQWANYQNNTKGMDPDVLARIEKSVNVKELFDNAALYGNNSTASWATAGAHGASGFNQQPLMEAVLNLTKKTDPEGSRNEMAQAMDSVVQNVANLGRGSVVIDKETSASNMVADAEQIRKLNEQSIKSFGGVEGLYRSVQKWFSDNPTLKPALDVASGMMGLIKSLNALNVAVIANTIAHGGAGLASIMGGKGAKVAGLIKGAGTRAGNKILAGGGSLAQAKIAQKLAEKTMAKRLGSVAAKSLVSNFTRLVPMMGSALMTTVGPLLATGVGAAVAINGIGSIAKNKDKSFFGDGHDMKSFLGSKAAGYGKSIGGGALTGAGIGFMVGGPAGAAIGAAVGAGAGAISAGVAHHKANQARAADPANAIAKTNKEMQKNAKGAAKKEDVESEYKKLMEQVKKQNEQTALTNDILKRIANNTKGGPSFVTNG